MSRKPAKKKFLKRMGLLIGLSAAAACAGRRSTKTHALFHTPTKKTNRRSRCRTTKSDKNPTRSTCSKAKIRLPFN